MWTKTPTYTRPSETPIGDHKGWKMGVEGILKFFTDPYARWYEGTTEVSCPLFLDFCFWAEQRRSALLYCSEGRRLDLETRGIA
jgi:hypothetical protein